MLLLLAASKSWRHPLPMLRSLLNFFRVAAVLLAVTALAQQKARELTPQAIEHIQAGLLARQENRLEDEVREFEIVVGLAPNVAEAHMNLGLALRKQGNHERAKQVFKTAIGLKPNLVTARALLGLDSLTAGRLRDAVQHLEAGHAGNASNTEVNHWLGIAYYELGRYSEAATKLEAAIRAKPEDPDILYYLTAAYRKAAEHHRSKLLEIAPESARAHQAMAERAAASGWKDQALEEYQKAAELGPGVLGLQGELGDLYASAAQYPEAEKAYRAELEKRSGHATLNFRCGEVILKQGRTDEAFTFLNRGLELDRALIDSYFQLGHTLSTEGKFDLAEKTYSQLIGPETPIQTTLLAHHRLAEVLRAQGKKKEASQHDKAFKRITKQVEKAATPAPESKSK